MLPLLPFSVNSTIFLAKVNTIHGPLSGLQLLLDTQLVVATSFFRRCFPHSEFPLFPLVLQSFGPYDWPWHPIIYPSPSAGQLFLPELEQVQAYWCLDNPCRGSKKPTDLIVNYKKEQTRLGDLKEFHPFTFLSNQLAYLPSLYPSPRSDQEPESFDIKHLLDSTSETAFFPS